MEITKNMRSLTKIVKCEINPYGLEFRNFKERVALKCISIASAHFVVSTTLFLLSSVITTSL